LPAIGVRGGSCHGGEWPEIPGAGFGRGAVPAMWSSPTRAHSQGESTRTTDRGSRWMRALPAHVSARVRRLVDRACFVTSVSCRGVADTDSLRIGTDPCPTTRLRHQSSRRRITRRASRPHHVGPDEDSRSRRESASRRSGAHARQDAGGPWWYWRSERTWGASSSGELAVCPRSPGRRSCLSCSPFFSMRGDITERQPGERLSSSAFSTVGSTGLVR
jgi:hypothetical protein